MRRRRQDIDGRELLGISSSFFPAVLGWVGWDGELSIRVVMSALL